MAKRLMVLVGMLAVLLAAAVPAVAQQPATGPAEFTGVVSSGPGDGGPPVFYMTDEASGQRYFLDQAPGADYSIYEGKRVTVQGVPRTDPDSGLDFLQPSVIRPLDGPVGENTISASFALRVEGEPTAGTTFYGLVGQEPVQLADPDGDGTYAGALTLPEEYATFPVPVRIIAGDPANPQQTIKDFGKVTLKDGDAFSAEANFGKDGGGTNPPETTTTPVLATDPPVPATGGGSGNKGDGDSTNGGGSDNGGPGKVGTDGGGSTIGDGPGSGGSHNSGSSGSGGSSASGSGVSGNSAESSGLPGGVAGGIRGILPETGGGVALWVLGAGVLLIGGGLLIRRLSR